MNAAGESGWGYVIVGSGAGGGTLAARLAESGRRVFLLEAGGDCCRCVRRTGDEVFD
jgi:choline dehydrogenase-like flavoprotein